MAEGMAFNQQEHNIGQLFKRGWKTWNQAGPGLGRKKEIKENHREVRFWSYKVKRLRIIRVNGSDNNRQQGRGESKRGTGGNCDNYCMLPSLPRMALLASGGLLKLCAAMSCFFSDLEC